MTQATNITVKKADGTTDIVYSVVSPSAGDGSAAIFRPNSVGTSIATRPYLAVTPTAKTGRRVIKTNFVYPLIDPVSGKVVDYITVKTESNASEAASDSDLSEAMAQSANLNASPLVVTTRKEGYGPN